MPDYLLSWIHLLAVITFIGGLIFTQLVLKPALQALTPTSQQAEVLRRTGRRFRTLAWVSLITLILTGAYSMLNESGAGRIETTWGVVLMLKLFVFAITFGLIIIHDFILDPYASSSGPTGKTSVQPHNIGWITFIQQAILFLTLAILLIASYLKSI